MASAKRRQYQPRRQLLHRARDHRVRLPRLPPLIDGPERPPRQPDLEQQETMQHVAIDAHIRPEQQRSPASPTTMPPMVGACNRSPPGSSASNPTIQNGWVVMMRLAIPLGISNSVNTRAPFPTPE